MDDTMVNDDTQVTDEEVTTTEDTLTDAASTEETTDETPKAAPVANTAGVNVVFVGSLAWATTDETLRKHFEDAGLQIGEDEVVKNEMTGREFTRKAAVVARYPDTKKSKGYGFVTLATPEDATKAVELLNDSVLDGRNIRVQLKDMTPREDRPRRTGGSRFGADRGGFGGGNRGGDRGNFNRRDSFGGDRGGNRYESNDSWAA